MLFRGMGILPMLFLLFLHGRDARATVPQFWVIYVTNFSSRPSNMRTLNVTR